MPIRPANTFAILIEPKGIIHECRPKDHFTLKDLHTLLECETFEIMCAYHKQWYLLGDESGKLKNLPINPIGTAVFRFITKHTDLIVGPVILCSQDLLE